MTLFLPSQKSHSFIEEKNKMDWRAHMDQALPKSLVWNQGPS